ncbi:MAG: hypothetical protein JMDDDDMK_00732 [Acidobacteria bacterium]|nr:hypothetical protein [Acidobacteriota bacterium]
MNQSTNLTHTDFEKLAASYLTPEIVAAASIRRVDSVEGAEIVGRQARNGHNYAGLVFPYIWPGETRPREVRLRRDQPDLEQQPDGVVKEKAKYLSPPGRANLLYFPPDTSPESLTDADVSITITEGEKKALALSRFYSERSERRLVIGLSGVWNWRGTVGKTTDEQGKRRDVKGVIPDFDRITWEGRRVLILFDANAATKDQVRNARSALIKELGRRGARVSFVDLPADIPNVNGVDDLLAIKGADFVADLLAQAKEAKKPAQKRQQVGAIAFTASESGVWATDEDGSQTWVCSQLEIEADTRDEHNENWGRLVGFPDRDGVMHQWAMPMALLSGDGREYRERLLELGLVISPGRKARTLLETYLNTKPEGKAWCVTKQGWHRGAFVLPDETIGDNSEPIYLQTVSANHLFRQSGAVEDWREQIGRYCAGNSRLILAASIGFAAPLLEPLQGENGGWHFTGPSSTGKTTGLLVAGSVHGGGGDKGFIRRWRATINGLETVAEAHHDSLLCLDEIAECRPDDVNEAAYMLANGQGKTRQSRGGALRKTLEWRLTFLSSGEISIADHVAQTGKRVKAGQEVRVINLPADAEKGFGLFEEIHDFENADEFARHLQRAARDYYGAPIRAFLRRMAGSLDKLRKDYRTFEAALLAEMLPAGAASEVSRVAHRFALAAFAGELATDYGITGWEPDEATAAAKALFQCWLDGRGTSGAADEEAALRQVRRFLELHGQSRFQQIGGLDSEKVINRAGYVERADDDGLIYYILPETFRSEVCAGFNAASVAKWLNARGWLVVTQGYQAIKRTPEGLRRFYGISSAAMDS